MNKNIGFILSVLFGVVCFSAGTYYSWMNMEERYVKYTEKWDKINSDVEQFVELSNPKTIRFYVSELREILDDMTTLSKVIEKGQEFDEALEMLYDGIVQLESEMEDVIGKDLENKETIELVSNHIKEVDVRVRSELQSVLNKELKQIDLKIIKQFDQIENELQTIKNLLSEIENSKIGKKIWKVKK